MSAYSNKNTDGQPSPRSVASKRRRRAAEVVDEAPLTPEEIQNYRTALLHQRRTLLGDMDHMNNEALHGDRQDSSSDLSTMPIHMADVGTDNYEQEFMLNLLETDRKLLREIDKALHKIEEGTYGICEGTGKQINRARLDAVPSARYCIEYARKIEQGLIRPEPDRDSEREMHSENEREPEAEEEAV